MRWRNRTTLVDAFGQADAGWPCDSSVACWLVTRKLRLRRYRRSSCSAAANAAPLAEIMDYRRYDRVSPERPGTSAQTIDTSARDPNAQTASSTSIDSGER